MNNILLHIVFTNPSILAHANRSGDFAYDNSDTHYRHASGLD